MKFQTVVYEIPKVIYEIPKVFDEIPRVFYEDSMFREVSQRGANGLQKKIRRLRRIMFKTSSKMGAFHKNLRMRAPPSSSDDCGVLTVFFWWRLRRIMFRSQPK